MTWITQLEHEHEQISKLLDAMDIKSIEMLETKSVDTKWFDRCLYFIVNYADKEHHEKEEQLIFEPLSNVNELGKTLVQNGMLIEHQQARYYVKEMKKLLDTTSSLMNTVRFIGFAQSYVDLLRRHIEKENHVAYPYAKKVLDQDLIEKSFQNLSQTTYEKEMEDFLNEL